MSASVYLADRVINSSLRGLVGFVSLHTAPPGREGMNEAVGGSYARQPVLLGPPADGMTNPTADIDFPGLTLSTVTHLGLWDAFGHFLAAGPLNPPRELNFGDTLRLSAEDLEVVVI